MRIEVLNLGNPAGCWVGESAHERIFNTLANTDGPAKLETYCRQCLSGLYSGTTAFHALPSDFSVRQQSSTQLPAIHSASKHSTSELPRTPLNGLILAQRHAHGLASQNLCAGRTPDGPFGTCRADVPIHV